MKKISILILATTLLLGVFSLSLLAASEEIYAGENLFTRSNLKAKGQIIYFHNMSKLKTTIPIGTAVEMTKVKNNIVKFKVLDTGKSYIIKEPSQYYAKYLVKDLAETGFENISGKMKENILNMTVVKGMTKKEVFMAKGCPAYIGYGEKSQKHSLEEIMNSDTWYYNMDTRKREMIVTFKSGAVDHVKDRA